MQTFSTFSPIVSDFIDFAVDIGGHEPDLIINHGIGDYRTASSPWCNCAVGEFFTKVKGTRLTGEHLDDADLLVDPMRRELMPIFELLNCSRPETYGELRRLVLHALEADSSYIDPEHWSYERLEELLGDITSSRAIAEMCSWLGTDD